MLKKNISKNKIIYVLIIIIVALLFTPLPFYLTGPGGITDVNDRIEISNGVLEKTFYSTYISEYEGNMFLYLYSKINHKMEVFSSSDYLMPGETYEDELTRGKIMFENSLDNALLAAYNLADMKYSITNQRVYIIYREENVVDKFQVGDIILKVNDFDIKSEDDISLALENVSINDEVTITLLRDNKKIDVKTIVNDYYGEKIIGIYVMLDYDIISSPAVSFNREKNEYGPSGGLMDALSIYYTITNKKIDLKIAGTGTIEEDGTVGSIGGATQKVFSVDGKKVDIFFVPDGDNYIEALRAAKGNKIKLNIVPVKSLEEAIDYIDNFQK